jgi:hypothetical protein
MYQASMKLMLQRVPRANHVSNFMAIGRSYLHLPSSFFLFCTTSVEHTCRFRPCRFHSFKFFVFCVQILCMFCLLPPPPPHPPSPSQKKHTLLLLFFIIVHVILLLLLHVTTTNYYYKPAAGERPTRDTHTVAKGC